MSSPLHFNILERDALLSPQFSPFSNKTPLNDLSNIDSFGTVPTTARLIALMLASQGVEDADERVLHQLMDFAHRKPHRQPISPKHQVLFADLPPRPSAQLRPEYCTPYPLPPRPCSSPYLSSLFISMPSHRLHNLPPNRRPRSRYPRPPRLSCWRQRGQHERRDE